MNVITHSKFMVNVVYYFNGFVLFFVGLTITPFWMDQVTSGMIGLGFLVIGVALTYFTKKLLEAFAPDPFKWLKRKRNDRKP